MLWQDKDPVVPTYIVHMEEIQNKAKHAGCSIDDNWLVDVASKSLLDAKNLPREWGEWYKLPVTQRSWSY